jgi:hypothetical protein
MTLPAFMKLAACGVILAGIILSIWRLRRKGVSVLHIGLLIASLLLLIGALFVSGVLIVDRSLSRNR